MTKVTADSGARTFLRALRTREGPVVVVVSARHCAEPMCFGLGDWVPGPHDVLAGVVEGCPVHADDRDRPVTEDVALTLASEGPPRLVLAGSRGAGGCAGAQRPSRLCAQPKRTVHR